VICGVPLGALDPPAARTCRNLACAWRFRITPPEQRCGVCERPLDVAERAAGVCAATECRRAWVAMRRRDALRRAAEARARRTREVRLAFEEEARGVRALRARALGVSEATAAARPVVPIPSYAERTTPLPAMRRRRLRAHLEEVVVEALRLRAAGTAGPPAPPEAPPPALAAAFGRACAHCRGHCCRHGAEHAYVREDTILRYLGAHPDATVDTVLAEYMQHVGARSYRGSCVYHGARGCTLPRTLRADICNRFLCDGLKELRDACEGGAPGAFLAWSRGGRTEGAFVDVAPSVRADAMPAPAAAMSFVDARELRVHRRPPPPAPPG
jgi:hypothetical protein